MKEKIYTIPVNEAYDTDCECPLCFLQDKLEQESVDYALGAAMMEPDYRIESNSKGYCRRHFEQMYQKPNKLQLALVLETHLDEIRKKLSVFEKDVSSLKGQKTSFFKKSGAQELCEKTASHLHQVNSSCMICDKINHTMERYIDVLLYLWINDPNFQKKFENSKGLCLPHMEKVCSQADRKSVV